MKNSTQFEMFKSNFTWSKIKYMHAFRMVKSKKKINFWKTPHQVHMDFPIKQETCLIFYMYISFKMMHTCTSKLKPCHIFWLKCNLVRFQAIIIEWTVNDSLLRYFLGRTSMSSILGKWKIVWRKFGGKTPLHIKNTLCFYIINFFFPSMKIVKIKPFTLEKAMPSL